MILQLKIVIIVFAISIALGAIITSIVIYMEGANKKTTVEQSLDAQLEENQSQGKASKVSERFNESTNGDKMIRNMLDFKSGKVTNIDSPQSQDSSDNADNAAAEAEFKTHKARFEEGKKSSTFLDVEEQSAYSDHPPAFYIDESDDGFPN